MRLFVLGLNHKTASVDIRERLAYDPEGAIAALKELKNRFPQKEFVLLSTCNRVEIYCAEEGNEPGAEEMVNFLSESRGVSSDTFREFLYTYYDEKAVRHLLTVTSSLDSMVLGEPQINAQVKESYRIACKADSAGQILNHLFHCAFQTSKEIYTSTSITNRRVSVAGVAVELAKQLFDDIKSAKIVVLGAGQMGELLVEHFLHIKCRDITVINRSVKQGRSVASRYGIGFEKWEDLSGQLLQCNVIVGAATAARDYLFDKSSLAKVMDDRRGNTLLIIDIAVPRSFDPAINDIENVYIYSIDDLARVVEENIELRQEDVERAVEIIYAGTTEFLDWFATKDLGPVIGQIKEYFDQIGRNELDSFFVGNRQEANRKGAMEQTVSRIMNKLLHCVISNIKVIAREQGTDDARKLANNIAKHAREIVAGDRHKREKSG